MSTARIDLPRLVITHPPQLDLSVITTRDDEWKGGMERCKVDTTIMSLEHVFDGRERIECVKVSHSTGRSTWTTHRWVGTGRGFAKGRDVPYSDGLIHRGRDYEIFLWVEEGGHDIVRVACEDGDAVSGRAVPDTDGLII